MTLFSDVMFLRLIQKLDGRRNGLFRIFGILCFLPGRVGSVWYQMRFSGAVNKSTAK